MRSTRLICAAESKAHVDKAKLFIVWVPPHLSGLRTLNNINVQQVA